MGGCGECGGCLAPQFCDKCKHCLDKKRYKKACKARKCTGVTGEVPLGVQGVEEVVPLGVQGGLVEEVGEEVVEEVAPVEEVAAVAVWPEVTTEQI